MPTLKWNELDLIECLEEIPIVDEHKTQHIFQLVRGKLALDLTVWPYDGQVKLSLMSIDNPTPVPIIAFRLVVRGEIKYHIYKRREWLEFTDSVIGPPSSYYWKPDAYAVPELGQGLTFVLIAKPEIRMLIHEYAAP